MLNITDVRIAKLESEKNLKAVAAITIDGVFVVHDIKIFDGEKGMFIAFPSHKVNGEFKDIAHPLNTETRKTISNAVIKAYQKFMEKKK